ncbi:class IV adenylate cyclase [Methanotorris igneus]|uniref:Adenylyl cyclase CyaB n=1 Tax=Methanotorris igneus (strain DSM 5666 / JCM 11834 / Kol 5) TaxID=880724 RepID=F6BD63_METIK|nr:class IV adenylate cyclase [Methanotorris igneus]AEF96424.1 adenylyl cyclase CyaB [Methanotorris igneus Kol 5]
MIEVEIKAKINEDELENIKKTLEELGFEKIEVKEQIDIYFNGIDRDFAKTDEALRIRKENDVWFITYKGPKIDKISKTREEIEVKIEDGYKMEKILEKLGFKKVPPIRKIREIYKKEDIEASIDNVDGVGLYLELEKTIKDEKEKDTALNLLMDTLKSLNISSDRLERKSYLELLHKRGC